jgi:hypothetical protein
MVKMTLLGRAINYSANYSTLIPSHIRKSSKSSPRTVQPPGSLPLGIEAAGNAGLADFCAHHFLQWIATVDQDKVKGHSW